MILMRYRESILMIADGSKQSLWKEYATYLINLILIF